MSEDQCASSQRAPLHVLIIDDDPALGRVFKRMLGHEHRVELASSGAAALQILAADTSFDVIFCDLMMPAMTGLELHAELLRHNAALAARLILMTGGTFIDETTAAVAETGLPVLEKPFGRDDALRAMAQVRLQQEHPTGCATDESEATRR